MGFVVENPYAGPEAPWLRGNLHTHTTNSDGPFTPQETVDRYAALGYDFLALSDHDQVSPIDALDPHGMALIPANEVSAHGPDIVHVDARSAVPPEPNRQKVFDAIERGGGFAVVAHPNWERSFAHCPHELMERWRGYAGLEIYNGVIQWLFGNPLATDRWDRLLDQGRRLWGFANDDAHTPGDIGRAWNVGTRPVNPIFCTRPVNPIFSTG